MNQDVKAFLGKATNSLNCAAGPGIARATPVILEDGRRPLSAAGRHRA
jgi:hypothetical protein